MLLVCSCHCFFSVRDKLNMFLELEFSKGSRSTTVNELFLTLTEQWTHMGYVRLGTIPTLFLMLRRLVFNGAVF
jgi:hypothetical protein